MACLGESDGSKKEKIAALPKLSAREPHAFRHSGGGRVMLGQRQMERKELHESVREQCVREPLDR